ncbi:MAG: hypothetical protein IKQ35_01935 [Bacilli bacterium]|nr:hypothetical protein [Bacilli bacterium]
MKIKNKFSKQRIDKDNLLLNKIMNIKKSIRNKTSKIIPLTDMEKFLYIDDDFERKYDEKNTTIPKNKYIRLNDIFLLNIVSKKDCHNLYPGIINLYKDNYLKGYLGGELRHKDIKKCIDSYITSTNHHGCAELCRLSPKDNELYELCDFIIIHIFEISNDLLGISFDLKVTEKFNDEINNIFNEKVNIKTIYDKLKYKKKYLYSRSRTSVKQKRNNDYEDFIIEFKCRFNKLFNKYIPLQLDYENKPPISINAYQTNFKVTNRSESFYQDLEILEHYSARELENISVCLGKKGESDSFVDTTMWYNIMISRDKIDRSNSVLFYLKEKEYEIKHTSSEFTNIFINSIAFYLLDEMQEDIANEKIKLYNCKTSKIRKNYKQYEILNSKFHKYSSIFNGIDIHKFHYNDEYITKGFENIKNIYDDYNKQLLDIKKEYEFRININNIKSTFWISIISVIIAIGALGLSIFFEYRNKNDNSIKNIESKVEINNNEIKEVNDYLNQIKDLIKKNNEK